MSNSPTIYRENPLNEQQFKNLEMAFKNNFSFKQKTIRKSIPKVDNNGDIYGWEYDLIPCGHEIFKKGSPDKQLLEALLRPATNSAIGKHLTRLEQHKVYTKGQEGFQIILEDMIHDLKGVSEFAIIKICENFRLDTKDKYFPLTASLVSEIKNFDDQLRWNGEYMQPRLEKKQEPEYQKPNDDGKRRVADVLHNANLPHSKDYCAKCNEEKINL